MRLIHTTTLKPYEYFAEDVPTYAILSHRWDNKEVTYQDLSEGRGPDVEGWAKVAGCCAKAASDGWDYAWIDSCCIDKTSSAELSEAINSMFKWYQNAQVCYAYLSDVASARDNPVDVFSDFRQSKWFTRGWTLQELLAPRYLEFYDRNWIEIGTKTSLEALISSVSGISVDHLFDYGSASIAQKMSWASRRVTKRPEDEAHCLMGLFDVNMPPLYGEGSKAFQRLQLEILSRSDDESIFAWEMTSGFAAPLEGGPSNWLMAQSTGTLLAPHARYFYGSSTIVGMKYNVFREAARMTSKGLLMTFPTAKCITRDSDTSNRRDFLLPLNCIREFGPSNPSSDDELESKMFVTLKIFESLASPGTWRRYKYLHKNSHLDNTEFHSMPMYFLPDPHTQEVHKIGPRVLYNAILVNYTKPVFWGFTLIHKYKEALNHEDATPYNSPFNNAYWTSKTHTREKCQRMLRAGPGPQLGAVLSFRKPGCQEFCLVIVKTNGAVTFDLVHLSPNENLALIVAALRQRIRELNRSRSSDRLSLKLSEDTYMSASMKMVPDPETPDSLVPGIYLSMDSYQRWPASLSGVEDTP